jgi:hypothetical protein
MKWSDMIGLAIVAFRGRPQRKKFGDFLHVPLTYILFDDKKTFIELHEQDQYDYHDCNTSARTINLSHDEKAWEIMFGKEDGFAETTEPVDFW